MGEDRKLYKVLVGKPEGKDHSEDRGIDERMGSEWILWRLAGGRGVRKSRDAYCLHHQGDECSDDGGSMHL
jgi:hypothetical protein